MSYDIKYNGHIAYFPVFIQCSWVRVFTEPNIHNALCIRSYDRKILWDFFYRTFTFYNKKAIGLVMNQMGSLTGNYFINEKNIVWLEVNLYYCDRSPKGWVRESDIWHKEKGCEPNELDWQYIPYTKTGLIDPGAGDDLGNPIGTKKSTVTAWLTAALGLLSMLK